MKNKISISRKKDKICVCVNTDGISEQKSFQDFDEAVRYLNAQVKDKILRDDEARKKNENSNK